MNLRRVAASLMQRARVLDWLERRVSRETVEKIPWPIIEVSPDYFDEVVRSRPDAKGYPAIMKLGRFNIIQYWPTPADDVEIFIRNGIHYGRVK